MIPNMVPGRFVPMHFRSRERNYHIVGVSFPGTKEHKRNICSHKLSSPVALLRRRPTRHSMHHYELFNYDSRTFELKIKQNVKND